MHVSKIRDCVGIAHRSVGLVVLMVVHSLIDLRLLLIPADLDASPQPDVGVVDGPSGT